MLNKLTSPLGAAILFIVIAAATFYFSAESPKEVASAEEKASKNAEAAFLFDTELVDKNGKLQSLQQWQGKIIVLNFWATWCEPCREEMPELSALHTAYQDKNLTVIGIALDEVDAIHAFSQENNIEYPLLSAEESGAQISAKLGNDKSALPYTVIIKPDSSIANTYFGRVDKALLDETLLTLF